MIHVLDTRQLERPRIIAATALETSEGLALFDTGPESTFANISAALHDLGARPADVRHVFLSHIHFDHAGAAWRFAETGATVYVHPRGATHLADPAKLVESATRIFGEQMAKLWGQIAPVPADKIRILEDNDTVQLGALQVRALETPGHASHHHVYHWDDHLFGGDIAGVRLSGGPPIPPFVPPELQIEAWRESLAKLRALNPAQLYLPHYGRVESSIAEHLDALDERVARWADWFRDRIRASEPEAQTTPAFAELEHHEIRAGGGSAETVLDYEAADPSFMAVTAAYRYWRKHHPAEVGLPG